MKGTLAEGVLPGLLRSLYVARKNGRLHIRSGELRRTVRFQRGQIVGAESNVPDERLGETLVRLGQLTSEQLQQATEVVVRDGKRLGHVLQEQGVFDADRLQDALSLQVHEILKKIFATTEGEFEFEEIDADAPVTEDMTLKVSTGEMILEAVDRVRDPEVVRRSLGDLDRRLALPSDPLLRFQKVTLTPTDGYILSRVDGVLSAREITQILPMPDDEVCRSLLGLLSTGLVEFIAAAPPRRREPAPPASPAPPAAAASPASSASPAPPPAPPGAPPAAAAPPRAAAPPKAASLPPGPPAPAPTPPPKAESVGDRRREIMDAWNGLKTRTHYEVLGLATDATATQVKEAYFRLARRFHPDVHTDPSLADLHDKLEAVFIRLGQAYEALKNRRDPEPAAKTAPPKPAAEPPPAPPPPGPTEPPATDPRVITEKFRRAGAWFQEAKYWDAIQILEQLLHDTEGKMQHKVRVLLAQCYMKNPNWVRRAEEQLQQVLAKEASHVDANYNLAALYKAGGLRNRSLTYLRKVLEVKPDHEQALADLAELAPPEDAAPSEGLLKKFFGKS